MHVLTIGTLQHQFTMGNMYIKYLQLVVTSNTLNNRSRANTKSEFLRYLSWYRSLSMLTILSNLSALR